MRWTVLALTLACVALAGETTGPSTSVPVPPYSRFAPIPEATSAISVEPRPTSPGAVPTASLGLTLAGPWRVRAESTPCIGETPDCEGMREQWSSLGYDDSAWTSVASARMPGRDLPDAALGGAGRPWAAHPIWYRTRIDVPKGAAGATRYPRLLFDAVDGVVDVWWDGVALTRQGPHWGTTPFVLDLRPPFVAGPHTLAVRVRAVGEPTQCASEHRPPAAVPLRVNGITGAVTLTASGPVRIDAAFVTARPSGSTGAIVGLAYRVSNLSQVDLIVDLDTTIAGPTLRPQGAAYAGAAARVTLHPGANAFELSTRLEAIGPRRPAEPLRFTATTRVTFDQPSDFRVDAFDVRASSGGATRDVVPTHPVLDRCGNALRRAVAAETIYDTYNDATVGRWRVPDADIARVASTIDHTRPVITAGH